MPTKKPRKQVAFTEEDLSLIDQLRVELQKPGRRGTPGYLPLRVTLNQWIARLALERARQIRAELRQRS